jgi:hypothetical protein
VSEHLDVRLVPISAVQIRVLESLQRVFFGLAADVNRELGIDGDDDSIARPMGEWSGHSPTRSLVAIP